MYTTLQQSTLFTYWFDQWVLFGWPVSLGLEAPGGRKPRVSETPEPVSPIARPVGSDLVLSLTQEERNGTPTQVASACDVHQRRRDDRRLGNDGDQQQQPALRPAAVTAFVGPGPGHRQSERRYAERQPGQRRHHDHGCHGDRQASLVSQPQLRQLCPQRRNHTITLTAAVGKRNATVWGPSVRLSNRHTDRDVGAACDAASVHFGLTIRTDILLRPLLTGFCLHRRLFVLLWTE